jgi:hypothetical protein
MSAIKGIRAFLLISPSASAASLSGTAKRTTSQPHFSNLLISAIVARLSRVSVFVMDWTTMGAPPPMGTPPTEIRRVFRLGKFKSASILSIYRFKNIAIYN